MDSTSAPLSEDTGGRSVLSDTVNCTSTLSFGGGENTRCYISRTHMEHKTNVTFLEQSMTDRQTKFLDGASYKEKSLLKLGKLASNPLLISWLTGYLYNRKNLYQLASHVPRVAVPYWRCLKAWFWDKSCSQLLSLMPLRTSPWTVAFLLIALCILKFIQSVIIYCQTNARKKLLISVPPGIWC